MADDGGERDRFAATFRAAMLDAGVRIEEAVLFTMAWLEAIGAWDAHMAELELGA